MLECKNGNRRSIPVEHITLRRGRRLDDPKENNMELKKRKPTRLKNFDYSTKGRYFITICTVKKEKAIFGKIKRESLQTEPYIQLTGYGEIVKKQIEEINSVYDDVNIYPYVIMPNHIHFIVEIDGSSGTPTPTNARIPVIVSTFKRMTNKKFGFNIWQRGYNDHIIRNDEDYLRIAEYIINNPYGKTW